VTDRWVKELATDPTISVFYTVDFESRVVELLHIQRMDMP